MFRKIYFTYLRGFILGSFCFTLLLSNPLQASHLSNFEINYEWIGDEAGQGLNDYRIYGTILYNSGGVLPNTGPIDVCLEGLGPNSSFSKQVSLSNLDPTTGLPNRFLLSDTNPVGWYDDGPLPQNNVAWAIRGQNCTSNPVLYGELRYVGTVTIPVQSGAVRLSSDLPCCRPNFDNLQGFSDPFGLALIQLSPNRQKNTTSKVVLRTSNAFGLRGNADPPLEINFKTYAPDADSLGFKLAQVKDGSCTSFSNAVYDSGFSAQSPFPSSIPISTNPANGTITCKPTQAGSYLIKLQVTEYYLDTASSQWKRVAFTEKEIPIIISNSSYNPTGNKFSLELHPSMRPTGAATLDCGDSTILLQSQEIVNPSTLAPDGSDFLLRGKSRSYPIKKADRVKVDQILLTLADTVAYKDVLRLQIQIGTDSNTVKDFCDYKVKQDTFLIFAKCKDNIAGITQRGSPSFALYPNPARESVQIVQQGEPRDLRLLNARGELVRSLETYQKETRVSLKSLSPGVYWIMIGTQRKRLIVY